jgi:acetyl esterase/lipase
MASSELKSMIDALRVMDPLGSADIATMRAGMDAAPPYPKPDDIEWERVDAGGVGAEWTRAATSRADCVLVYFHGGGYALGSAEGHRAMCSNLARATRSRVLNVDYRLAPEAPFPAAVEDAVAAYRFALSEGVEPSRMAVGGDSAGGGLALATLVSLRDAGDPLPAAGVAISPWVDMTLSSDSIRTKQDEDPLLKPEVMRVLSETYLAGADPKSPTASPLFAELGGLPPILIQVGTAELLQDEAGRFAEAANRAGVDVSYEPWDEMFHVWHLFADMLPEGRQAIERIAAYLDQEWGAA